MSRTGRNDVCPCGSGKKFKRCCASRKGALSPALLALVIAAAIVTAIVVSVSNARTSGGSGRVWSPEHGHYHDASGREIPR